MNLTSRNYYKLTDIYLFNFSYQPHNSQQFTYYVPHQQSFCAMSVPCVSLLPTLQRPDTDTYVRIYRERPSQYFFGTKKERKGPFKFQYKQNKDQHAYVLCRNCLIFLLHFTECLLPRLALLHCQSPENFPARLGNTWTRILRLKWTWRAGFCS